MEEILKTTEFAAEQQAITDDKLGNNHVYFLPYLMGERSPHNDANARGTFIGMSMDSSRADMYLRIFMDRIFSKFTQYFPIVQVWQALRAGPD